MKDLLKITVSLVAIFVAAGLIMGLTYKFTSPIKFQAEKKEKEEALKEMAPTATDPIKPSGKWSVHGKNFEYYEATASSKPVAFIASTAGKGYSSFIQMLVSLSPDLKISDVKVLSMNETPGLGDQVLEKSFLDQFKGKSLSQIVLIKGETKENIQAISGATISSRGVTNGIKDAVQTLVDKYGAGIKTASQEVTHEH
ncbi:MAG: FMN-binding protein [Nitrospiraceae bacterium]|nr:FMN-binding protein [Nitrospiraceae bacterium]